MNVSVSVDLSYVLAGLPALHRSEYVSKWVSVDGPIIKHRGPYVLVETGGHKNWLMPKSGAKFSVVIEKKKQITQYKGSDLTLTQAVIGALAAAYVFDLQFGFYTMMTWEFLGEHVCGLPKSAALEKMRRLHTYRFIVNKLEPN